MESTFWVDENGAVSSEGGACFGTQKHLTYHLGHDRATRSMRHFKEGISGPVTVKLGARLHLRYPEERFTSSMSGLDL